MFENEFSYFLTFVEWIDIAQITVILCFLNLHMLVKKHKTFVINASRDDNNIHYIR